MNKFCVTTSALCFFAASCLPSFAADCGQQKCGWDSAVAYCRKKGGSLPTIEDLLKAWEDKCTGGRTSNLCSGWYWSSKEMHAAKAWGVDFSKGEADFYEKGRTTTVFCGPKRKAAVKADPKKGAAVNGAKCARGECTWHEAAAYCGSSGTRLYKTKEWYDLCHAECKNGEKTDNCKRWFWLGESEGQNYGYSGTCDSPADASVHSVEKTSRAYARCASGNRK